MKWYYIEDTKSTGYTARMCIRVFCLNYEDIAQENSKLVLIFPQKPLQFPVLSSILALVYLF